MATNIEIYEALKGTVGEDAARMVAEAVPRTEHLATKADLAELRTDFAEFKADMRGWMLTFFVPLWIGVYGTLAAVVISIIVR